jgi:hypothetical protein
MFWSKKEELPPNVVEPKPVNVPLAANPLTMEKPVSPSWWWLDIQDVHLPNPGSADTVFRELKGKCFYENVL